MALNIFLLMEERILNNVMGFEPHRVLLFVMIIQSEQVELLSPIDL